MKMVVAFQGLGAVVARSKPSRLINEAKCKSLIKQVQSHLSILKKRRQSMMRQTRGDIAQLLQNQQLLKALYKVKKLYQDQSLLSAYDQIEQFCGCIATNMPQLCRTNSGFESLPIDVLEAASSLVFAASRCGELQELNSVRYLLKRRFGYEFDATNVELKNGNLVNSKMKKNLCIRFVRDDEKLKLIKEIAEEQNLQLWFQDLADKQERFSSVLQSSRKRSWREDNRNVLLKDCCSLDSSLDNLKEQNGSFHHSSHVHPKLPEYEDVVAKLTDLKLKFQDNGTISIPGHSQADIQESLLSSALKCSDPQSDPLRDNCKVLVSYSSHVHPKLPEYEDVVTRLTDLKVEYKQRRLSEGSHRLENVSFS